MFRVIISIVLITITSMSSSIPRKDYETHHPKLHHGIFRRESGIDTRESIGIEYPNRTGQPLPHPNIYLDRNYSGRVNRKTHFLFPKQSSAETLNNRKSDEWIQRMDEQNKKSIAAASVRIDADNEELKAISISTPSDEDFYEAVHFGIQKMNEFYSTGEPELYSLEDKCPRSVLSLIMERCIERLSRTADYMHDWCEQNSSTTCWWLLHFFDRKFHECKHKLTMCEMQTHSGSSMPCKISYVLQNSFEETKELWDWYKRIFTVAGVWPLQSAYPTFTFWTVYSCLQFVMDFLYMLHVVDDLDMIMNVGELTWVTMTIPKLIVLRFSRKLANLLIKIRDEVNSEHLESIEEKEIYLAYHRMAKSFVKVLGPLTIVGVLSHYFKPFAFLLRAVLLFNESVPLILPFRTHLFFDVNNYFTLSLWWIYQFPMIFVNALHPVSLCFAVFLIFHACGELSALAIRIKNLGLGLGRKTQDSGATFRYIVDTHHNITGITNDINDVFNLLFLEELFMTSVMIILTSYTVIVKFDFSDTSALLIYAVYTIIMFTLIYGSCVAGEYLIMESTNVYEAYYQCQWYDLPDTYKKQLIICMIGSSKPIYLLGGSFYIFSLTSFTNVLKTAMSYVSLLRTLI